MLFKSALLAALASTAYGHGTITSPQARTPGSAMNSACGSITTKFYQADNTSYPEALHRANPRGLGSDYNADKCNLYLCRGYQFSDNSKNVFNYKTGDKIPIHIWIRIPHNGYANVSVVDTTANKVIGTPLIDWPSGYANEKVYPNLPANQTSFTVTVPDLGSSCTTAGQCVRMPRDRKNTAYCVY